MLKFRSIDRVSHHIIGIYHMITGDGFQLAARTLTTRSTREACSCLQHITRPNMRLHAAAAAIASEASVHTAIRILRLRPKKVRFLMPTPMQYQGMASFAVPLATLLWYAIFRGMQHDLEICRKPRDLARQAQEDSYTLLMYVSGSRWIYSSVLPNTASHSLTCCCVQGPLSK